MLLTSYTRHEEDQQPCQRHWQKYYQFQFNSWKINQFSVSIWYFTHLDSNFTHIIFWQVKLLYSIHRKEFLNTKHGSSQRLMTAYILQNILNASIGSPLPSTSFLFFQFVSYLKSNNLSSRRVRFNYTLSYNLNLQRGI